DVTRVIIDVACRDDDWDACVEQSLNGAIECRDVAGRVGDERPVRDRTMVRVLFVIGDYPIRTAHDSVNRTAHPTALHHLYIDNLCLRCDAECCAGDRTRDGSAMCIADALLIRERIEASAIPSVELGMRAHD